MQLSAPPEKEIAVSLSRMEHCDVDRSSCASSSSAFNLNCMNATGDEHGDQGHTDTGRSTTAVSSFSSAFDNPHFHACHPSHGYIIDSKLARWEVLHRNAGCFMSSTNCSCYCVSTEHAYHYNTKPGVHASSCMKTKAYYNPTEKTNITFHWFNFETGNQTKFLAGNLKSNMQTSAT